jgi:nucleotide-binding universal stress UspA family protein
MNKLILLGVGLELSPPTQHALCLASELLEHSWADLDLVLLSVIPIPYDTTPAWGKSLAAVRPFPPTTQERLQAEHILQQARRVLQQRGIAPHRILPLQRVGVPADEIARTARELDVHFIVIGSHRNSLAQGIRRVMMGSTSRRVLRMAPCPVLLAIAPGLPHPGNLVAWYKEAVTHALGEHPGSLLVFTACDVAQLFAPPDRTVGGQEVDAATRALEALARGGVLCCHRVKGEVRYSND